MIDLSSIDTSSLLMQELQEKTQLLEISKFISTIATRKKLLETIVEKIAPLFGFDDIAIFVLDKSKKYYSIWFDNLATEYTEGKVSQEGPGISVADNPVIEYCLQDEAARIVGREFMVKQSIGMPEITNWLQISGTEEALIGNLKVGGEIIGCMNSFSRVRGRFNKRMTLLYQTVCELIAVAVANIVANEEILERQREKDLLLSLGEALSEVRQKEDLINILLDKVKLILPFDELPAIFVLDDLKEHYFIYYDKFFDKNISSETLAEWKTRKVPVKLDPVATKLVTEDKIQVLKLRESQLKWPDHPGVKISTELNLLEALHIPLRSRGMFIGLLSLNAHKEGTFSAIKYEIAKSVGELVSNALANILANEEILEREKEKSLLLSLSEAMASVRNSKDLWTVVMQKVKVFVGFEDAVVIIFSRDKKSVFHLLTLSEKDRKQNENYSILTSQWLEVKDSPFEWALAQPSTYTFTADYLAQLYPNYPGLLIMQQTGLGFTVANKLKWGDDEFGILNFHFKNEIQADIVKMPLYKSIADQISIAVANIIANDEILKREQEKILLLSLSGDIAGIRDKNDLWKLMMGKVKDILPFNESQHIAVLNPDGNTMRILLIDPSLEAQETASYQENAKQSFEYRDTPFEVCLNAETPEIYSLHYALQHYPDYWGTKIWIETGIKEMLTVQLKHAGKVIGAMFIHSTHEGKFSPEHFNLFKSVADQVSSAVANIMANEEILEREKEKSILLSLSNDFATIKDKNHLFQLISAKIAPVFKVDDLVVFVVDQVKNYYYLLLSTAKSSRYENQNYELLISRKLTLAGSVEEWILSRDCAIINFDEFEKKFPSDPGIQLMKQVGLKDSMVGTLRNGGSILGSFHLHAEHNDYFKEAQLPLFRSVCDQLAVAIANVLANEEILEREKEMAQLLEISEQLSKVRNKYDLFDFIFVKLRPIFNFNEAVIVLCDEQKEFINYLPSTTYSPGLAHNPNYQARISTKVAVKGTPYEEFLFNSGPKIYQYEYFAENYPDFPGVKILKEFSLIESIYFPMKYGGKTLGTFQFHSTEKGTFKPEQMNLFKNLGDQIAVAVSHMLANEEILEREQEKTLLLSLSEDMATIRNRENLYGVMMQRLKPLVGFDDAVVVLFSKDLLHHNHFLTASPAARKSNLHYEKVTAQCLPVAGTPYEYLLTLNSPYIWTTEQIEKLYPDYPGLLLCKETGLNHCVGFRMEWAGQFIGLFQLAFNTAEQINADKFSLYKSICDQVTVAVANILANEDIIRKDKEKDSLLSISKQLSTIRSRNDLFDIFLSNLQSAFAFDDAVIVFYNEELTHRTYLHSNSKKPQQFSADYEFLRNGEILNAGTPYEEIVKYREPVIKQQRLWQKAYPNDPGLNVAKELGLKETIYLPLNYRGKLLGTLGLHSGYLNHFKTEQIPLYLNLADQVAVALSNILANEDILQIKKYKELQVSIGAVLAKEMNWKSRFRSIAVILQRYIPFNLMLFVIRWDEENCNTFGFYRTGKEEYQLLREPELREITRENEESFKFQWSELGKSYQVGQVFSSETLDFHNKNHPIKKKLMDHFRLSSNLHYPIYLGDLKRVSLSFFHQENRKYEKKDLELLNNILDFTSLCLERVMAFDQVEELSVQLRRENVYLQEEIKNEYNFDAIIGNSLLLKEIFKNIALVAPADTTVLITGETGTGKELVARSIHNSSNRKSKPLIKVNCAALPAQLIESELFGHEKGSFTGAFEKRIGKFELANGGSIFLDEIGELPLELQAKLLRVLQEKEFERIGGKTTIKCDVRIIAATNRDLEEEMNKGRFRADLFYRLNVYPIHMPRLRDRKEDIPLLAAHFAQKYSMKMNRPFKGIIQKSFEELLNYDWPGNIRELENVIEQSVIISNGDSLFLGRSLINLKNKPGAAVSIVTQQNLQILRPQNYYDAKRLKEEKEKEAIISALTKCKGRIRGDKGAAALLGIKPNNLDAKMNKYGIFKDEFNSF